MSTQGLKNTHSFMSQKRPFRNSLNFSHFRRQFPSGQKPTQYIVLSRHTVIANLNRGCIKAEKSVTMILSLHLVQNQNIIQQQQITESALKKNRIEYSITTIISKGAPSCPSANCQSNMEHNIHIFTPHTPHKIHKLHDLHNINHISASQGILITDGDFPT